MSLMEPNDSVDAPVAQPAMAGPKADHGDVQREFHALVFGSGVYDLSLRAKISLTGEDRVRWLNGMVTNNVRDLERGRGVYAFLLNPQGHILGDLYAYNRGESLLVDTDQSQVEKILAVFDKYIIMDDVEVANVGDQLTAVGIAGPKSRETLQSAGQFRRKFTGFAIEGKLPAVGSKIQVEGKDVGEIPSASSLPVPGGERLLALGYIRREAATPGKLVEADGSAASVANLPFTEIFR